MKVAIRTDASLLMGSGHVMRCLTLARSFREKGADVSFLSRELAGNLIAHVERQGMPVFRLPALAEAAGSGEKASPFAALAREWEADAALTREALKSKADGWDLLIVDHYGLDGKWEGRVRDCARKLMVIDDLADRPHDCDLLLDQNYYRNMDRRYAGKVPDACKLLLGPRFALLRPEFREALPRRRDGETKRILVFFGGMDATNETAKCLEALASLDLRGIACDVVVGGQNPHREEARRLAAKVPGAVYHEQVDYMARLMATADLAVGAGGATTWERCYLGLPCLTLLVAENQTETTQALADFGAIRNLGWSEEVRAGNLASAIKDILSNPAALAAMSEACLRLMSGNSDSGVLDAVRETVLLPAERGNG